MFDAHSWGILSLLPLVITLAIAFKTKSATFSLFIGILVGAIMLGMDPACGFRQLAQTALGNGDFIWLCIIIIFIGIFFELLKRAGVIYALVEKISKIFHTRKDVQFVIWLMGFFIVDDYFSPLMFGEQQHTGSRSGLCTAFFFVF